MRFLHMLAVVTLPLHIAAIATHLPRDPKPNATCAAVLNAWCNNVTTNGQCIQNLAKIFPNWFPLRGIWAGECGSFTGSGANETCGDAPSKPPAWRCYSHLALYGQSKWDGIHPIGCSRPQLGRLYDKCMGVQPLPPPPPPLPTKLKVSNVLGSGMVLQRTPARARIWGTAPPTDEVTVTVAPSIAAASVVPVVVQTYTTIAGPDGHWAVRIEVTPESNPYTIEINSRSHASKMLRSLPIVLTDVLAGEVHICSGQSNMDFTVAGVFNATGECAIASDPNIRLFKSTRRTSAVPLNELDAPPVQLLNWSAATPAGVCGEQWHSGALDRSTGFSAACFFYAQELQQTLQVPVGAIHTAWGGTNIENWMSEQAMDACPEHTAPGVSAVDAPSVLFNAMIAPFAPIVAASFLWWQGESNAWTSANAEEYSCNQKAMIKDLRTKFDATPSLPFIFVQSFPLYGNLSQFQPYPGVSHSSALAGLSELRLAQADSLSLPMVGMACTIDLGDVGCPFTWEHNRAKRPCAHRAALAARAIIYNESTLVYRGPAPVLARVLPFECSHGGCGPFSGKQYKEIVITFRMFGSSGFLRSPVPYSLLSFEVLFADASPSTSNVTAWVPATLLPAGGNVVPVDARTEIAIGATAFFAQDPIAKAVRYAHGDFPTGILHNQEGLPIPPFVVNVE